MDTISASRPASLLGGRPRPGWCLPLGRGALASWYLVSATFAVAIAAFSSQPVQRCWGCWAAGGYVVAALITVLGGRREAVVAAAVSFAGAVAAPLAWQATLGRGMSRAGLDAPEVVARSAALLLHHGTPYLPSAQLTHLLSYNPYLPLMSVFGLPGALGLPGLAGDPRLWFLLVTAAAFIMVFRLLAGGGRAVAGPADGPVGVSASWAATLACAALVLGSPVLAPQVITGGTDVPVLALVVLALALACSARPGCVLAAGLILGAACALKTTAWPAVPVLAAMLAARDGFRSGARFAAATGAAAVAGIVAAAPAALAHPATVIQNTVMFPLGLGRLQTPAASPLPGHLLASAGPAAHRLVIVILVLAGAAVAGSLIIRPPASVPAAARRLALGLALMIILAPATRWGYCVYPLGLAGWLILARPPAAPLAAWPADRPYLTCAAAGSDDAGVHHLAGLALVRDSLTQAGARHDHSGRNRYRAGSRHRGQAGLRHRGAGAAAP